MQSGVFGEWRVYEEEVRSLPPTTDITVPKDVALPPHFTASTLVKDKGEQRSYREDRATDSIHVREYEEEYLVHVDRFNPHHHPVRHLLFDAAKETVQVVAGVAGMCAAAWHARTLFR